MATSDGGYLNLLQHLRRKESTLSKDTLHAAISHYLNHLPPVNPTPTPLVAFVVTSRLWHPFELKELLSLSSALRNAVRFKYDALKKEDGSIFRGSVSGLLSNWIRALLEGLENGDSVMKMAVCGGTLMGLNDIQLKGTTKTRVMVEKSLVLSFSEVLEGASTQSSNTDTWEKEFLPRTEDLHKLRLNIALLLASHHFPFVSDTIFSANRLPVVIDLCLATLETTFKSGHFLSEARVTDMQVENIQSNYELPPHLVTVIEELTTSVTFQNTGPVCRLLARSLILYSGDATRWKRPLVWDTISRVSSSLEYMSEAVERDWSASPLQNIKTGNEIAASTRSSAEKIWLLLKTMLFSMVLVEQAILDAMLYLPSSKPLSNAQNKHKEASRSAPAVSSRLLSTLLHLSFVVAEFGGVATQGISADSSGGFPEMKKAFYMCLDLLAADERCSMDFMQEVFDNVHSLGALVKSSSHARANTTLALACMEQLVSVADEHCVRTCVLPLCEPFLSDPEIRETYELAHSVMLAVFAAHAKKSSSDSSSTSSFYHSLVPGYAKILLQNAETGKLTTAQCRVAYSALVRSAGSGSRSDDSPASEGNALAWLCVAVLLEAAEACRNTSSSQDSDELERLHLTLISLTSNVPVTLLRRLLGEVGTVIEKQTIIRRKKVLVDALYEEILERLGDAEKEVALKWWYRNIKRWDVMNLEEDSV